MQQGGLPTDNDPFAHFNDLTASDDSITCTCAQSQYNAPTPTPPQRNIKDVLNMNHPSTPSTKATLSAVLALTAGLLAAQARADVTVYQDNCNGNDFSSRYTFNSVTQNAGYSAEFPASAGNMALAERSGLWSQFQTTSYANGNFSDTTYTVSLAQYIQSGSAQQQLLLTLLNNGYTSNSNYAGYQVGIYIDNTNQYYAWLNRVDINGASTSLVAFTFHGDSKVIDAWSNLSYSVAVTGTSSDLSLYWSGVDASVSPYNYQVFSYSDTSVSRYTSGSGLAYDIKGAASTHGYFLDNITVTAVPEPACLSLLALGGLALRRRQRR